MTTTVADGYAPVGLRDVVVPFLSRYRPVWLGLGALALDLLLALVVTSLARKRLGYRAWRAVHWAAYAAWPLALAHGLGAGSDARFGWMALLSFGCLALVAGAAAARLLRDGSPRLKLSAGAALVALVALIVSWYRSGPAQHGWAARAGTPPSLLGRSAARRVASLAARRLRAAPPHAFDGRLLGRVASSGPDANGDAAVAIAAAVRGREPGVVRLTLWGAAVEGGGLAMSRSVASFADAATGVVYSGRVVGLDGNRIRADVASRSGSSLRLDLTLLQVDPSAGRVSGVIHVAPGDRVDRHDGDVE